jgi:tRNA-specific 2-thiouridylase
MLMHVRNKPEDEVKGALGWAKLLPVAMSRGDEGGFSTGPAAREARIVVAMSGGVDSSVVAALAARTGAEVIGVTLQLYDHGAAVQRTGSCCAGQDIYDARTVADRLGIAHYVFDYESRFRDSVIDRFADEYMRGRTPIPCIACNQGVKFTDLLTVARELGADCLATAIMCGGCLGRTGRSCTGRRILRGTRAISCS